MKKISSMEPRLRLIRTETRMPDVAVKSILVWKAKRERASVMPAQRPTAIRTASAENSAASVPSTKPSITV